MTLSPDELGALGLSLKVAFWATVASLPLAVLAALLLRRPFPGRAVVDALIHLPLVLPPVVTGYLLLAAFGTRGWIGAALADIGIVFAFRWTGAALAAAVMGFPLMVRAMRIALDLVDRRLEEAAATLGAGPATRIFTVTLPLILPGIIAGAVLSFARGLGEFGATITFVSNIPGETQTLATAIYGFLQVPGGEDAAVRLTVLSIALSLGALMLSDTAARYAMRWNRR